VHFKIVGERFRAENPSDDSGCAAEPSGDPF
jgi:hypothetical protein